MSDILAWRRGWGPGWHRPVWSWHQVWSWSPPGICGQSPFITGHLTLAQPPPPCGGEVLSLPVCAPFTIPVPKNPWLVSDLWSPAPTRCYQLWGGASRRRTVGPLWGFCSLPQAQPKELTLCSQTPNLIGMWFYRHLPCSHLAPNIY